jgi:hypothetical protein
MMGSAFLAFGGELILVHVYGSLFPLLNQNGSLPEVFMPSRPKPDLFTTQVPEPRSANIVTADPLDLFPIFHQTKIYPAKQCVYAAGSIFLGQMLQPT